MAAPGSEVFTTGSSAAQTPVKLITSTAELVKIFNGTALDSPERRELSTIILDIIEDFRKTKSEEEALIAELVPLAECADPARCMQVLAALIQPIKENVLTPTKLLIGLGYAVSKAKPEYLNQDDLLNIVKIVVESLKKMHDENPNTENIKVTLKALNLLLNAMVDANVMNLPHTDFLNPMHDALLPLVSNKDASIAFQAAYAQQALIRLPRDESKIASIFSQFQRFEEVLKSLGEVLNAILQIPTSYGVTSIKALMSLYSGAVKFKKTMDRNPNMQLWYEAYRGLEFLLLNANDSADKLAIFEEIIATTEDLLRIEKSLELDIHGVLGLIEQLKIIASNANPRLFKKISEILKTIFEGNTKVGKNKIVREAVLTAFIYLAGCPEQNIAAAAKEAIDALKEMYKSKQGHSEARDLLFQPGFIPTIIKSRAEPVAPTVSTRLLDEVLKKSTLTSRKFFDREYIAQDITANFTRDLMQRTYFQRSLVGSSFNLEDSIKIKLRGLQKKILENQSIAEELKLYIPCRGSKTAGFDGATFDLESVVMEFFKSDKTTLLVMGPAGAGKTTLNYYLIKQLWSKFEFESEYQNQCIPIFISLPLLRDPEHNLLVEYFTNEGFTQEEIAVLQQDFKFNFILDAYDETGKRINFFQSNKEGLNNFAKWNAHTLITCRTQYFTDCEDNDYRARFIPYQGAKRLVDKFQEIVISPFSVQQISAYIAKYIALHPESMWSDVAEYEKHIDNIPALRELVGTPFLLMITLEAMPAIVKKYANIEGIAKERITTSELYDKFIEVWFEREEDKHIAKDGGAALNAAGIRNVKKYFMEFCLNLGETMFRLLVSQGKPPIVEYEDDQPALFADSRTAVRETDPWKRFFDNTDQRIILARTGSPLKKVGPHKTAFIHASFVEYFAQRKMDYDRKQTLYFTPRDAGERKINEPIGPPVAIVPEKANKKFCLIM